MPSRTVHLGIIVCELLLAWLPARAEKIQIVSDPPGASVEIDGRSGTTPFETEYPNSYFHDPHFLFNDHLNHPITAHLSLAGYIPKDIPLTGNSMEWVSANGHKRFQYWIFRSTYFPVKLEMLPDVFNQVLLQQVVAKKSPKGSAEFSVAQIAEKTKSAVVYLRSENNVGTGFFVSSLGLIATNAHVVFGQQNLKVFLVNGQEISAAVYYIHPHLDFALLRASGKDFPFLALSDNSLVHQGDKVVAMGNPGEGLPYSVAQGIVSAVGRLDSVGAGTWIQTDAAIDSGYSGGPLLNLRGEVVGITTTRIAKPAATGIAFALSVGDILTAITDQERALANPEQLPPSLGEPVHVVGLSAEVKPLSGVIIFDLPIGAQIFVDESPRGNIPARINVSPGNHTIALRVAGQADCMGKVSISPGDVTTFRPDAGWVKNKSQ